MPELLTRRETPQSVVGRLAGFKSEWWPTSIRNDGRLPVGISGRLQSESAHEPVFVDVSVDNISRYCRETGARCDVHVLKAIAFAKGTGKFK